jgi:hypothetical protein
MKIKNDFITNSSSCSFIVTIITKEKRTLKEFKKMFNRFLDIYEGIYDNKKESMQFWNPKMIIKKSDSDTEFEIHEYTSMYNDYDDIPHYIRYLLLTNIIEPNILKEVLDLEELKFKEDRDEDDYEKIF